MTRQVCFLAGFASSILAIGGVVGGQETIAFSSSPFSSGGALRSCCEIREDRYDLYEDNSFEFTRRLLRQRPDDSRGRTLFQDSVLSDRVPDLSPEYAAPLPTPGPLPSSPSKTTEPRRDRQTMRADSQDREGTRGRVLARWGTESRLAVPPVGARSWPRWGVGFEGLLPRPLVERFVVRGFLSNRPASRIMPGVMQRGLFPPK